MIGDKASLQSLRESISHFRGSAELSKWFSSDMHAQITADAYNLFVVMINPSSSQVFVRAPSPFQSAEEIRAAYIRQSSWGCYLADPVVQGIGTLWI